MDGPEVVERLEEDGIGSLDEWSRRLAEAQSGWVDPGEPQPWGHVHKRPPEKPAPAAPVVAAPPAWPDEAEYRAAVAAQYRFAQRQASRHSRHNHRSNPR